MTVRIRIRLATDSGMRLGPGKAGMLRAIRETKSINAAARRFRMSYRRAWLLVEEMNCLCDGPLVVTRRGGAGGGGAEVTPLGEQVLAAYEALEQAAIRSKPFAILDQLLKS